MESSQHSSSSPSDLDTKSSMNEKKPEKDLQSLSQNPSSEKDSKNQTIELLLQQNSTLAREVSRLLSELDSVTAGIQMKGYLHKWRDREITFASKWGLRYFVLQKNTLSYFADDSGLRPRRTIPLQNCFVKDEGCTRNGTYYIFSIYSNTHASDSDEVTANLLMRLSTSSKGEAQMWIHMLEDACRVDTAVNAANQSKFDFEEQPLILVDNKLTVETHDDVPLPKLSIQAVVNESWEEQSAVDDTFTSQSVPIVSDDHLTKDHTDSHKYELPNLVDIPNHIRQQIPHLMDRILASQRMIQKSLARVSPFAVTPKKTPDEQHHKSGEKKKSSFVLRSFPASKPMHVKCKFSPLSAELRHAVVSYRGFFNLGVIILILTHFRLIIDNLVKYGVLLQMPWATVAANATADVTVSNLSQVIASVVSWIVTIFLSYSVEKLASKCDTSETTILSINYLLGACNLIFPCVWVWMTDSNPLFSMLYLFQSVVIWMKMISYSHVNRDHRILHKKSLGIIKSHSSSSLLDVTNESSASSAPSPSTPRTSNLKKLFEEIENLEAPYRQYPQNLTIPDICYFTIVPTLCYQINYPRSPHVRFQSVLTILIRMLLCGGLILLVWEQYIRPILEISVIEMNQFNILGVLLRLMKLSIPSTYMWLLGFYLYFHLWLNLLAEITRFGDREFYKDWWNSRNIESYWRLWNLPVHHWMLRHLYYPMLRMKISKSLALLLVFAFSALFHEVVISVPFRYVAFHAFLGMLAQAPLVSITKYIDRRFDNPFVGNVIFWMSFCIVGQPMGLLMYSYDFWKIAQGLK